MKNINLHISDCKKVIALSIKELKEIKARGNPSGPLNSFRRDLKLWRRALKFYKAQKALGVTEI
jgi:hypothetical protein